MESKPVALRLGAKRTRGEYVQFFVSVPKAFVVQLKLEEGDILIARIVEVEVDGVRRKGIFYYKP